MPEAQLGNRYQPEVDGLRAVAIVATVLFHAKVPGAAGGFVGVDVFFVISGYLITGMLLAELARSNRIDLVDFYARRIRRLLPALLAVVLTLLLLGAFLLKASGERQSLSASAIATLGFIANIHFWRIQAHYFAGPAEWLPLLNMWTLSVEGQFYLLWPLLLVLAAAIGNAARIGASTLIAASLAVVFAASLVLFVWGAAARPTAAFYLAPTRAWELALGGGLALAGRALHRFGRLGGIAASLGVALIVAAVLAPPHKLDYSTAILTAAFGSAAVIAGVTISPDCMIGRALALKPCVYIGKISYSWYLWHWPLLALGRLHDFGQDSLVRDMAVIVVSLGLAALTYSWVEEPVRRRKPWPCTGSRQTIKAGVAISAGVAGIAIALHLQANEVARRDPWLSQILSAKSAQVTSPPGCHVIARKFSGLPPVRMCAVGADEPPHRLLIWGDSHAAHLIEMVRTHAAENGYSALAMTASVCPPQVTIDASRPTPEPSCKAFNEAIARELPGLAQAGLKGIVLGSRSYGWPGEQAKSEEIAIWKERLRSLLSTARDAGLRVVVVAPVPGFRFPVPECLARLPVEQCGLTRSEADRMRRPLVGALREVVSAVETARLWDPIVSLCDRSHCLPAHAASILYSDQSHLTTSGSRSLALDASASLDWVRE